MKDSVQPMSAPPAAAPPAMAGLEIRYHAALPPSIGAELDVLYGHLNCSLSHFRFGAAARRASAYVAVREGRTTAIFLFVQERRTVTVLNEMIAIDATELDAFACFVFDRFPDVSHVAFSLIGKHIGPLARPSQQHGGSEDIVVSLPGTVDAYCASLTSKTRQTLRHRLKTLARDHPGLTFRHYHDDDIDPAHVHALVALKRQNCIDKGVAFGIAADEAAWIAGRARAGGLVTLAVLDGVVCGGSVSLRIADTYFAALASYDGAFGRHSLGMLCCYLTILEKIARGARATHLGWGRNPYKFTLRGVRHDMARLDIYRSWSACLAHADRWAGNAIRDRLYRTRMHLLDHEADPGYMAGIARTLVRLARTVKRARNRATQESGARRSPPEQDARPG